MFENVRALTTKRFLPVFNKWQAELSTYGYTSFAQVLNARDYGVPQNRERLFMVSILDCEDVYYFPKPFPLERRLADVLESDPDEGAYLSEKIINLFYRRNAMFRAEGTMGFFFHPTNGDCVAHTITCKPDCRPTENFIIDEAKRIRALTPREAFRLMDLEDADINKIEAAGISKTQQYKLAGNSIVVAVLYHIFRKLFIDKESEDNELRLF